MTSNFSEGTKLSVWRTVGRAYSSAWNNRSDLVRFSWLWALVLILGSFLINWLTWPFEQKFGLSGSYTLALLMLPSILFSSLVGASVAIAWHRLLLAGEHPSQKFYLRLDRSVGLYFLWLLFFFLFVWLPMFGIELAAGNFAETVTAAATAEPPSSEDPSAPEAESLWLNVAIGIAISAGFFFGGALLSYVPIRLSLLLPALALGHHQVTARETWRRTKNNFWRLYIGSILVSIPPVLAIFVGLALPEGSNIRFISSIHSSFFDVIALVFGVIAVGFLSFSYRIFFPELLLELAQPPGEDNGTRRPSST